MNDFKMRELSEMKCSLISYLKNQFDGKLEDVDTDEAGKVADIIKDLAEAEKNCYESCYYKSVIDAMEDTPTGYEDLMGYNMNRNSRGQYSSRHLGYKPMVDQEPYINGFLHDPNFRNDIRNRQMGYVDPMSMQTAMDDVKSMWDNASPERRKSLKKELSSMLEDLE